MDRAWFADDSSYPLSMGRLCGSAQPELAGRALPRRQAIASRTSTA